MKTTLAIILIASATAQALDIPSATSDAFTYLCIRKRVDLVTNNVCFDRMIEIPKKGYHFDNPGAQIGFRTDARKISVKLHYSDRHTSTSARNGQGLYTIDGQTNPEWTFSSSATTILRPTEDITVSLSVPPESGFHDYAVVLPYGDSVELCGLTVNDGARFEPFSFPSKIRYMAFGDSITQGFAASDISHTYPFLLAENKHWQMLNMGFAGRSTLSSDGLVLGELNPDLITILIGVNDWQGGKALAQYQSQMEGLLHNIRQKLPNTLIYLITPLWVDPNWKPKAEAADLESYRQVIRNVAQSMKDPYLRIIEGPGLIDHDAKLFDKVAVHPNDEGFAMMADRLAREISFPPEKFGPIGQ